MSFTTDRKIGERFMKMIDDDDRIEQALHTALEPLTGGPPKFVEAVRFAIFPGGLRIRPRLCAAVGHACRADQPELLYAAAASVELIHCASLVHDDLPCFDNALTRRGLPSVHAKFGQPLAVLVGDQLIVSAFEVLVGAGGPPQMLSLLTRAVGSSGGIIAGQAWECDDMPSLAHYHRAKTGSLFALACAAGALAAGCDPASWFAFGERIGEAYQVADDLRDVLLPSSMSGKPVGQDERLGRPSALRIYGIEDARLRLRTLVEDAIDAIPSCPGRSKLTALVDAEMSCFNLCPIQTGLLVAQPADCAIASA